MRTFIQGFLISFFGFFSIQPILAQSKHPNVIFVLMDDLGYGDLGITGAMGYETPQLDALAKEGTRFSNFVTAQAVCSASRAAYLTGCYPNRLGISGALFPNAKVGLNPSEETLAELFKAKNYRTALFGKWHLGDHPNFLPLSQGFDEYAGIPYSNDMWPVDYNGKRIVDTTQWKSTIPPLRWYEGSKIVKELHGLEEQDGLTEALTQKALAFIEKNKQRPFFMMLAHHMVHVPLGMGGVFKGKSVHGMFGDVMMEVDASMGRIRAKLKTLGLDKNTIIIFTSDNGPWLNYGNHAGSSGGFREGKGTSFEGGHRVPFLFYWPGKVPAGQIQNKLTAAMDLLPTLAEICGLPLPQKKVDGLSFWPILSQKVKGPVRREFYYYYRKNSLEAVRLDDWKLVLAHPGRTYEGFLPGNDRYPGPVNENAPVSEALYDLRRDPGERYDVKKLYPKVYEELQALAEKARKSLGDDIQKQIGLENRPIGKVD